MDNGIEVDLLRRIELIVLDVDGVLTDGSIHLSPSGEEFKTFHVRDGSGMKYWRRIGGKLAILSGRSSPAIEHRAADLEVDALRLGAKDKLPVFEEMLGELGVSPADTAVMGDDLPDLPLLRICGFSAAPHDAVPEVLREVRYITRATGGRGAVREFIEQIMRPTGQWERILQRYLPPEQRVGPAI